MDPSPVIQSQYRAALEMLRQAIDACPDALWAAPTTHPQSPFWRVAYHAVFYAHLYLQPRDIRWLPLPVIMAAEHLDLPVQTGHQNVARTTLPSHLLDGLGAKTRITPHQSDPDGFAPAGELVPQALRVLRPGGTLALAGIHMSPLPVMPYELLYGERTIRSVANSTRQDAQELLALAASIPIHTEVTPFPLREANSVLAAMKASRFNGDAVLVP